MSTPTNRRSFIKNTVVGGSLIAAAGIPAPAADAGRVLGANDRIQIGLIGCGGRGRWHVSWLHRTAENENLAIIAAADVWKDKLELGKAEIQNRFGGEPRLFDDYRALLDDKDIDAVVIATADHQHCTMLREAVQAGKDAYVEKPIAVTLDDLNQTYDVVTASKAVVQIGTQGRSSAGARAAREAIQTGRIGRLLRVEECRSHDTPYWNNYDVPRQEGDTDWQQFLLNQSFRPFNPDQHGHWMGYRDFSSGTVGGWMSHYSDFIHYVTGCGFPARATAAGGVYAPDPISDARRNCPDTITAILHYGEGFSTLFTTHFGNGFNDYTLFFGSDGTMKINEPDGNRDGIAPVIFKRGDLQGAEPIVLDNTGEEDHMANWVRCIRTREKPNADIDAGYKHGVACILADAAFVAGRNMTFDPARREIRPV